MHFMKVDIADLIKQAGLENDSKIKAADLDFRWKLPDHKLIMWLDSQKTYRIFENLIVNITKYAMPHTRVYIAMEELENEVHISMKNISASELTLMRTRSPTALCEAMHPGIRKAPAWGLRSQRVLSNCSTAR